MKREARDFRETAPKPVERIPLDIKNPRLRLVLTIMALAIAAGAFFIAFRQWVRVEPGWTALEADGAVGINVSGDFTLQVELGAGTESPLTERKRLTSVYSTAAREAYTLYSVHDSAEEVHNLWYINHHPDEEIVVDPRLYRALKKSVSEGNWLYLGPVYEVWDSVWFSQQDREAAAADPRLDSDLADYLEQVTAMIRDGDVQLEFPDEQSIRLKISERYRTFGEENDIERWIDFGWQRNAYIIDDLAESLTSIGWTRAVLSSRDGFIRCLDDRGDFRMNLYAYNGTITQQIARAQYSGPSSLLMLLPCPGSDRSYFYRYQDGALRTAWISLEDGLDVHPVDGLAAYSAGGGCADLLNRFLLCLTNGKTVEEDWKAATGEECSILLAAGGKLLPMGSNLLIVETD